MIARLYVEDGVRDHPIAQSVIARYPDVPAVPIERYAEVFNRRAQNFRLQKRRPSLILARKFSNFVLPTPPGYGIGQRRNYYFSHMLNCVYDCRYCFLQGMYRSAHYVLFVNYEDFRASIAETLAAHPGQSSCFFSGYDCDSLALEPISGFVADLLPFFAEHRDATLELRTKSTQIRPLLRQSSLENVVVAFSLTPEASAVALEHKAPSIERRLGALARLAEHGWPIGLRFDPLIFTDDYAHQYRTLFERVFARVPASAVHSVCFGPFRLPKAFYRRIEALYPDEPFFAPILPERDGMIAYPSSIEQAMRAFCERELERYVPSEVLFPSEF